MYSLGDKRTVAITIVEHRLNDTERDNREPHTEPCLIVPTTPKSTGLKHKSRLRGKKPATIKRLNHGEKLYIYFFLNKSQI